MDGEHFKERKHWLNDDYVKFLRYGQHCQLEVRFQLFSERNSHHVLGAQASKQPVHRPLLWLR